MNKLLVAKANLQMLEILSLLQAEKDAGWDKDPPWVKRGKNGQFGSSSGDSLTTTKTLEKKLSKLFSKIEDSNKQIQKDLKKMSQDTNKKLVDFVWSDEAGKARKDVAKTLDKHLPGAGKSFEESVNFINKEIIDRSDPRWDKFLAHSFERNVGRLKRRVLNQSTPIDRMDDAVDAVAGIFASNFTAGTVSLMFKAATLPLDITLKALELEYKAVGSLYVKALQSDNPVEYIRNLNIGITVGIVSFYGLAMAAMMPSLVDALAAEVKGINSLFDKDIAFKVQEGVEFVQKDIEESSRSQQAEINSKLQEPT